MKTFLKKTFKAAFIGGVISAAAGYTWMKVQEHQDKQRREML